MRFILIWSFIVAFSSSAQAQLEVLKSVEVSMSVRHVTTMASARDMAKVTEFCKSIPLPQLREASPSPFIWVAGGPYSTKRVYKKLEQGELAHWDVGLQSVTAQQMR